MTKADRKRAAAEANDRRYEDDRQRFLARRRGIPTETVEQYLARGGEIKRYHFKDPPVWKQTFNGFEKCVKRRGKPWSSAS